MKKRVMITAVFAVALVTRADVVFDFYTNANLYGALDEQQGPVDFTIDGVTATFTAVGGVMNRTNSGFGINADGSADTTYALDSGEALQVSFDQDVIITALDFRNFENGETMNVTIKDATNPVEYNALSNQTTDSIDGLSWSVSAGDTVDFAVAGDANAIALDSITVAVPEPAVISMLGLGGLLMLVGRRVSHKRK